MKKITAVAMLAALILGLSSICFADFVKGFKVVDVSGDQITIQKGKDEPVKVPKGNKNFKVGEEVSFDPDTLKLRVKVEGC